MFVERKSSGYVLCHSASALRGRLRHVAQRVPAYQSLVPRTADEKLSAEELLSLFPTTDKRSLIEQGAALYELELARAAVLSETSGTTGTAPLITPRSAGELAWNSANLALAFDRHLDRGVDRVAILHPGILSPFAEACGRALERIGVPFIRIYPVPRVCDYRRLLDVLRRHQITTVMTTASLALKLLYERTQLGSDDRVWGVRRWLLTGELLSPAFMRHASQLADAQVSAFVYGSSEAATCAIGDEHNLYEPCLKDFAFELVPASETGLFELSLTWLNAGVRPLVRYRTGDLFELRFEGDGVQRRIRLDAYGRADSPMLSARARRELDEVIFGSGHPVYHYELGVGPKQGKLDIVIGSDGLARRAACAEALREDVSDLLGRPTEVQINAPDSEFLQFSPSPKSTRIFELRDQEPQ